MLYICPVPEQRTKINAWNLISLAGLIYMPDIEFELHFKPCVNLFPTQSKRECIWLCLLLGVESLQKKLFGIKFFLGKKKKSNFCCLSEHGLSGTGLGG